LEVSIQKESRIGLRGGLSSSLGKGCMNKEINTKLLELAREIRQKKQIELADFLSINKATYGRIESGAVGITPERLERIAEYLDFPVDFFLLQTIPPEPVTFFRKKASLNQNNIKKAQAVGKLIHLHLGQVKKDIPLNNGYLKKTPSNNLDLEELALKLRKDIVGHLNPIINLTDELEKKGIMVIRYPFDTECKINAFHLHQADSLPIIILNEYLSNDRTRFTLAHELGHIIMHDINRDNVEEEADNFASFFLLPKETFFRDIENKSITIEFLLFLKSKWKVSMGNALYRISKLRPNEDFTYLWRQLSYLGYRKQEPITTSLPFEETKYFKNTFCDFYINVCNEDKQTFMSKLYINYEDLGKMYKCVFQ